MDAAQAPRSTLDLASSWEQCRVALLAKYDTFTASAQPAKLYVLVDGRANPGVDNLLEQVPRLAYASLWQGSIVESYTDIAPYLIQIDRHALEDPRDLQRRLLRRLWREGNHRQMLTWIWSPLPFEALGEHFRFFSKYALPDGEAFFLHFYDNRILDRLRAVWTTEQATEFIAPCIEIGYRDREQREMFWRNAEVANARATGDSYELSAEQHKQLLWLGRADKLAMQLRSIYGTVLDDLSDVALYRTVTEQISRAGLYRLTRADDFLSYVSKGVILSPRFDDHPTIKDRLSRAANGEITHEEALNQIDRQVLLEASLIPATTDEPSGELA